MEAKISIIILTFNSSEVISGCLKSVTSLDYPNYRIIVVDNVSSDKTVEIVKSLGSSIKLLQNKENLGFSGGNNVGIQYAIEDEADFIFLLNPDTWVTPDALKVFVETVGVDPKIGIIGPKTLYFDDSGRSNLPSSRQGGVRFHVEGRTLLYAGGILDWQNAKNYHRGQGEIDDGQYNKMEETGFVSGAALFISQKVIEKIGLLDEKYFLYYEDADWCVRAGKAGFKIMYQPRAVIYHQESTATKKGSPNYYYYFTRNRLYFIAKFFNPAMAGWLYFLELLRAIKNIIKLFNKGEREQSLSILQGMGDFVKGRYGSRKQL